MGVIGRQATKLTIANLSGLLLGVLNTLFIYPAQESIYGLIMFVISTGTFLEVFASLGINSLVLRFFPKFKDVELAHRGFLAFMGIYLLGAFLLFLIVFNTLGNYFFQLLLANRPENAKHLNLFFNFIPIIALLIAIQSSLTTFISQFHRVVVPGIVVNVLPKFWVPIIFYLAYYKLIDEQSLVYIVIGMLFLSVGILIWYVKSLGHFSLKPQWAFFPKPVVKEILVFAMFALLGSVGTQLAYRIDQSMVGTLIGVEGLGIYALALTIAVAVELPAKSVLNITGPIIGQLLAKEDYRSIESLYRKSALNMTVAGLFLFLGLFLIADDLFLMTKYADTLVTVQQLASVIVIGKLLDMMTGPNDYIIGLSKYYKFNLFLLFGLSLLSIFGNVRLIPIFGLYGPPIVSILFLFTFNATKVLFIWRKFKISPFSSQLGYVLLVALLCVGLHELIPGFSSPILNLLVGSLILISVYILPILYWNLAPDISAMLLKIVDFINKKGLGNFFDKTKKG